MDPRTEKLLRDLHEVAQFALRNTDWRGVEIMRDRIDLFLAEPDRKEPEMTRALTLVPRVA